MGVGDLLDALRRRVRSCAKGLARVRVIVRAGRREAGARSVGKLLRPYAGLAVVGLAVVVLVVVVTLLVLRARAGPAEESAPLFPARRLPDEAFLIPEEPDFLPPVILYRERKERWAAEDAAPFWTDPATLGAWHDKLEAYVDSLLESVP